MMTFTGERAQSLATDVDRRHDERMVQEREVRIHEPFAARSFEGITLDVSTQGMRLRLGNACHLRPGRIISLHLGLNACGQSLANRRRSIPARVVWVEHSTQGTVTGIELLAYANVSAA